MAIISVIGAGWLGWPLAQKLSQQHRVFASKRNVLGLSEFSGSSVSGFICDLSPPDCAIEKDLCNQNPDVVIGSFPPGLRSSQGNAYLTNWQRLISAAQTAKVEKLIMVSTTGVYPDAAQIMREEDATLEIAQTDSRFSDKSRLLLQAEQAVIESGIDYVIIRSGGLFGPNRNPSRFATKLKSVSRLAPANMIYLSDIINVINFAQSTLNHEVINAVSPLKPSKAEFYQAALAHLGQESALPPIVDIEDKAVSSDKLLRAGFTFEFPSPIDALPFC